MATFKELQDRLTQLKYEETIKKHLADYLESNFIPGPSGEPKLVLMTDDKVKVPQEAIDAIVEGLLKDVQKTVEDAATVLASTMELSGTKAKATKGN